MSKPQTSKGLLVLIAASIVSAVLGTIHGFSVFIEPLEIQFGATRSQVSLTYSLALVTLTFAVLFGPRIFGRWSAATFILCACGLAAIGALLAGIAGSLPFVWLGFSLIFGLANGLGYGFGLQIAAQVNPGREGLAMGIVTAAYAFGAVLSPIVFDLAVGFGGFTAAMKVLAVSLLGAGTLSAILMWSVQARFQTEQPSSATASAPVKSQLLLWLGYFGGVLAGLMVIGHAAGIAASLRPDSAAWVAPVVIAACNLMGSLVCGRLADRISLGLLLTALATITSVSLAGLALFGEFGGLMIALGVIGFAYGGTIATYPAVVAKLFGMAQSARIYGRVFTAWGLAGLLGPWLAGSLFDTYGDYRIAMISAAAFGLVSVVATLVLFGKPSQNLNSDPQ